MDRDYNRRLKRRKKKITKTQIFYSRTYRHLNPNYKIMISYYLLFALPCLYIFLLTYGEITKLVSKGCIYVLSSFVPIERLGIAAGEFLPYFGDVFFITLPNKVPSPTLVVINIIIIQLLLILCYNVKDRAKPIAIYFAIALYIHLAACLFFLAIPETFPYTITEYSELYMKQQVGIWVSFIVIAGFASGWTGQKGISKFIMFFAVAAYSFIFGTLRYAIYLVILIKGSTLYMAMLFFTLGPFFDFLYLVCIYSIYMRFLISKFDNKKGVAQWQWA